MSELLYVGRLGRTLGFDGTLCVYFESDLAARFSVGDILLARDALGSMMELEIAALYIASQSPAKARGATSSVRFTQASSKESAKALINLELYESLDASLARLEPHELLYDELLGLGVYEAPSPPYARSESYKGAQILQTREVKEAPPLASPATLGQPKLIGHIEAIERIAGLDYLLLAPLGAKEPCQEEAKAQNTDKKAHKKRGKRAEKKARKAQPSPYLIPYIPRYIIEANLGYILGRDIALLDPSAKPSPHLSDQSVKTQDQSASSIESTLDSITQPAPSAQSIESKIDSTQASVQTTDSLESEFHSTTPPANSARTNQPANFIESKISSKSAQSIKSSANSLESEFHSTQSAQLSATSPVSKHDSTTKASITPVERKAHSTQSAKSAQPAPSAQSIETKIDSTKASIQATQASASSIESTLDSTFQPATPDKSTQAPTTPQPEPTKPKRRIT